MNVKDRVYNRRSREMKRRSPDWRMRPPSVDGRDNTTRLERGPQGSGGDGAAGGYAHRGGLPISGWHRRRAEQTRYLFGGMAGSALTSTMLRKAPYRTVRCLMLRAGVWENPMSGISGGGGWKRVLRWNREPTRNRKGGTGQASTYGSARQCPTRRHTEPACPIMSIQRRRTPNGEGHPLLGFRMGGGQGRGGAQ